MDVTAFVLSQLPPPPAGVLEVGCGSGELARSLAGAGYDVLAIDPDAPSGPIFRRQKVEDLDPEARFDAVVAVCALHHVAELGPALDRIRAVLDGGGLLVLDEFGWDRLDAPTADWFHGQQRALAAAGRGDAARTLGDCRRDWEDEHAGLHGYEALRAALDARFEERFFAWTPYLHRLLDGVASESLERALIEADAIRAVGFRYADVPR